MFADSIYSGCNSYYERYHTADGALDIARARVSKLEKTKRAFIIGAITVGISGFVGLQLLELPILVLVMMGGFGSTLFSNFYFSSKVDTVERFIRKLIDDKELYASLHNAQVNAENRQGHRSSSRSSSSRSYGNNEQRGTFKNCVTVKDVKKIFRDKAKKHHPDVGGDAEVFKTLMVQYERALKIAKDN